MRFLKTYVVTLILCWLFAFFGGLMLFDFHNRFYVAIAVCAFPIAGIITAFMAQNDKIEELENRVSELENREVEHTPER